MEFDGTNIDGATNATLSLTNVGSLDDGTYTVTIANANGSASRTAVFALAQAPQIASDHADRDEHHMVQQQI